MRQPLIIVALMVVAGCNDCTAPESTIWDAHQVAVDLERNLTPSGGDFIIVPVVRLDLRLKLIAAGELLFRACTVFGDHRPLAAHDHAASLVLEEAAGPLFARFHVGLVPPAVEINHAFEILDGNHIDHVVSQLEKKVLSLFSRALESRVESQVPAAAR